MTEAQIIEWCSDIGKRIATGNAGVIPLTRKQAARIDVLRQAAAEQRCRPYALISYKWQECRRVAVG
jgi:hypothetical protein